MPLSGHRIFLVEDEAAIALDIMDMICQARGEVVAHATNLAEALRLADTPDLSSAILDYNLGPQDFASGCEAARSGCAFPVSHRPSGGSSVAQRAYSF